jgi:hypothetical protein
MRDLANSILVTACLLIAPFHALHGAERNVILWRADGVSFNGVSQLGLYPVKTVARIPAEYDPRPDIAAELEAVLQEAGLKISPLEPGARAKQYALQTTITRYQPGSVGERWVGFGGGAAVCILRTRLIDSATGNAVGEIIVAEQVAAGGLFTVGAEKQVPKLAARQTASELATLIGRKTP